ncbi:MAG TPA: hypothetical protein VKR06_33915 [Ktedonosporobacter sp.]|nr:hypothetical protein [Ktedonosporobacter sp.]
MSSYPKSIAPLRGSLGSLSQLMLIFCPSSVGADIMSTGHSIIFY